MALPNAEFGSVYGRAIDAPVERVWEVLFDLRWSDLTLSKGLVRARYPWRRPVALSGRLVEPPSPGAPIHSDAPRCSTSGFVSRPWQANPGRGPAMSGLEELRAFREPGWLKLGMDMQLTELPGRRTYLQTVTLCEPTDETARNRFRAYWTVIKPFSGLIRLDVLAATARRAISPSLVRLGG